MAIARQIQAKLTPQEGARLSAAKPVNPAAYEVYLRGRYHFWKLTPTDKEEARKRFEEAIQIDPQLALAHSGLADYYVGLSGAMGNTPPQETMPMARAAAQTALQLDEQLSEAHTSLAWVLMSFDYDWANAGKEFDRALELNPNNWQAHFWRGFYLGALGKVEEAVAAFHRTQELDPLYPSGFAALPFYWSGQYDKASAEGEQWLQRNPNDGWAMGMMGMIRVQQGRYAEAVKALEQFATFQEVNPTLSLAALGHAYATAGQNEKAQKILDQFLARERQPAAAIAMVYAALENKDEAFKWLERAYAERTLECSPKVEPRWKNLRSDPRFGALLKKMNLKP